MARDEVGGPEAERSAVDVRQDDAAERWRRFETMMADRLASGPPKPGFAGPEGDAGNRSRPERTSPVSPGGGAPVLAWVSREPSGPAAPRAESVATPPSSRSRLPASLHPAPDDRARPARSSRAVWRHRLQGAGAAVIVLFGAFAAGGWFAMRQDGQSAPVAADSGSAPTVAVDPPVENASMPETAAETAPIPGETASDVSIQSASDLPSPSAIAIEIASRSGDETAVAAAIAAAEPPYDVIVVTGPETEPREIARLGVAMRAWGFPPAETTEATAVEGPAVRFFHPEDRAAAEALATVAARVLGGAHPRLELAEGEGARRLELRAPAGAS